MLNEHHPSETVAGIVPRGSVGRRGLSLVELLVSMAIVTILMGLLVVGVQAARESSRKNQCASQLRQIGLGVAQYESTFKAYPSGFTSFSVHVGILPFIEQQPLYDKIRSYYRSGGKDDHFDFACPIYSCPSDAAPRVLAEKYIHNAGTNYAGCSGSWHHILYRHNGVFCERRSNGPRISSTSIPDGLSNTIGLSEILRADGSLRRMRVVWNTPTNFRHATELDGFADFCERIPPDPTAHGWHGNKFIRGTPWSSASMTITLYNHVSTPNHPSCFNKGAVNSAAATSASNHTGGVNALYMDGHIAFVSNAIDRIPWRKLATISDAD